MSNYETEQEKFWSGQFGEDYINRNQSPEYLASNISLFAKILANTHKLGSVIEFGANIGMNLEAIRTLFPKIELSAIEINATSAKQLDRLGYVDVFNTSILEFQTEKSWDLSLIKGVLIHINPDWLGHVYDLLYQTSARYICICEYYNPTPVSIPYRGHDDKLFKRDFAGEMLDRFPDLSLVDYGFSYHRDNNFKQDDATWFLLEKR
ncbi:MAG: pseudaminic acid biosynthesis-associated methylase [Gammaproteobacteria bacterium]|nr:pseudaminic acid biosynthesis-associated methylase [Gammaproteobacteria bacterium]